MKHRHVARSLSRWTVILLSLWLLPRGHAQPAYQVERTYLNSAQWNPGSLGGPYYGQINIGSIEPYHGRVLSAEAEFTCGIQLWLCEMHNVQPSPVVLAAELSANFSAPGIGLSFDGATDPLRISAAVEGYSGPMPYQGYSSGYAPWIRRVDGVGKHWTVRQSVDPGLMTVDQWLPVVATYHEQISPAGALLYSELFRMVIEASIKATLQVDFGRISGRLYEDRNGNQQYDAGEPVVPRGRVYLFHVQDNPHTFGAPAELVSTLFTGYFPPFEFPYALALTDDSGYYEFPQVPPGYYWGWAFTGTDRTEVFGDLNEFYTFSGQSIQRDAHLPGAGQPQIWEDRDADGRIGFGRGELEDESGFPGIEMRLTRPGDPDGPGITFFANALGQLPRLDQQIAQTFGNQQVEYLLSVVHPPGNGIPTFDPDGIDTPHASLVWYQPLNGCLYSWAGEPPRFGYALLSVDYLTRDPQTGERETMGGLLYESVPIPAPDLSVVSTSLADNDKTLRIKVRLEFRDTLNELLGFTDAQRVTHLEYSVNGEAAVVEPSPEPVIEPNTVPFWRQYNSRTVLTKTLVIPRARAGTYIVRVVSAPNAVGNKGWAQEAVFAEQQLEQTADGPRPRVEFKVSKIPKQTTDQGVVIKAQELLVPVVASATLESPVVLPGLFDGPTDALEPYAIRLTVPDTMASRMQSEVSWNLNGEPVHLSTRRSPDPGAVPPDGFKYFYVARGPTGNSPPWCLALVRGRDELEPKLMPDGALATGALILGYEDEHGSHIVDNRPIVTETSSSGGGINLTAAAAAVAAPAEDAEAVASLPPQFRLLAAGGPAPLANPVEQKGANGYSVGDVVRAFLLLYGEPGYRLLSWTLYGSGPLSDQTQLRADIYLQNASFLGLLPDKLNGEGYGYFNWSEAFAIKKEPLQILISDQLANPAVAAEVLASALENVGNGIFAGVNWRHDFNLSVDTLHQLFENIVAPDGLEEATAAAIIALRDHRHGVLKAVTADLIAVMQIGITVAVPAPVGAAFTAVLDVTRIIDEHRLTGEELAMDDFLPVLLNQLPWPMDLMVAQGLGTDEEAGAPARYALQPLSTRQSLGTAATLRSFPRSLFRRVHASNLQLLSTARRQLNARFTHPEVVLIKPLLKEYRRVLLATKSSVRARVALMRLVRQKLEAGELTQEQLNQMVKSGVIPKISKEKQRRGLRSWLGLANKPGHVAHHDLAIQFEDDFLRAGLDPNDPEFGLAVDRKTHTEWHEWRDKINRFDGGPYNAAWQQQFRQWKLDGVVPSAETILEFRRTLHSGKIIKIKIPGGGAQDYTFTFRL